MAEDKFIWDSPDQIQVLTPEQTKRALAQSDTPMAKAAKAMQTSNRWAIPADDLEELEGFLAQYWPMKDPEQRLIDFLKYMPAAKALPFEIRLELRQVHFAVSLDMTREFHQQPL